MKLRLSRRSRRQIVRDILYTLKQARNGLGLRMLIEKANYTFILIKPIIEDLIKIGLIERENYVYWGRYKIKITSKGQEVLHHFFITQSKEKEFGFTFD